MNKSSLPASISALAFLCGCTVSASQQNFGSAATTAAAAGGATASFTAQVYSEQRFTSLSHDFLSHRPTERASAKSCPTTAEKEVKKRMARPACKGFLSGSSVCANVSGLEVVPRPRWSFRAYRSS